MDFLPRKALHILPIYVIYVLVFNN